MSINAIEVAKKIQARYYELAREFRHEDGWDPVHLAALPWDQIPQASKDHFVSALTGVLQDLLPQIRATAIEGAQTTE